MTLMDRSFMGEQTQDTQAPTCLARAISAELSLRYPHHTAKHVAQDLRCTPKAAANLLDGHLSAASVAKVISAYGPGWVAERVLEAAGWTLETYIRSQAAEARATAHRHQEKARELAHLETQLAASRRPQPESRVGRIS
jgi:hypothetical protein